MEKLSQTKTASFLKQAAATIRSQKEDNDTLSAENSDLREKIAGFEREQRVEAIARDMEDKGLNDALDFNEKVASLREQDNLDVMEEAVKVASPQTPGLHFQTDDDAPAGSGASAFETFIVTGEVPQ
jgi:hypothetical protein